MKLSKKGKKVIKELSKGLPKMKAYQLLIPQAKFEEFLKIGKTLPEKDTESFFRITETQRQFSAATMQAAFDQMKPKDKKEFLKSNPGGVDSTKSYISKPIPALFNHENNLMKLTNICNNEEELSVLIDNYINRQQVIITVFPYLKYPEQ